MRALLQRIARRCPTHDHAAPANIRKLEQELGMRPSLPPASFVDAYSDPDLVDCGNSWCKRRR
ncbi:hypothetical protein ACFCWG_24860 [Streptomyces sp. NPDC056390]|uniref:hypothetical protein n=1 Tax=Streptomyces sp. NPDC056390 TaxID=3345806 RepID=UPI0035DB134F